MSFASAYALLGRVLHVRPAADQGFNSGGAVTPEVIGRKGWQVGILEHGHAPAGRLRTGDNNARVRAQQVGAEQTDS